MPRLLTDTQALEYPSLVTAEDREQLLADAARLYDFVERNPFATEDRLRARADAESLGPDRVNAALGFLVESGRLVAMPDSDLPPAGVIAVPRDVREWTLAELQALAKLLELAGRSSMNRDELLDAILNRPDVAAAPEPTPEPSPQPATEASGAAAARTAR